MTEKDGKVWIGEAKLERIATKSNKLMLFLRITRG